MNTLRKVLAEVVLQFGKDTPPQPDSPASTAPLQGEKAPLVSGRSHRLGLVIVAGRILVLITGIAAVYLAVGSWMFPAWFFGFIWKGKIASLDYWRAGFSYWLDERPGTLAWAIVVAFVLSMVALGYRRLFLPFVDRFKTMLAGAFLVTLAITAVLDYKYGRRSYELWEDFQRTLANMESAMGTLLNIGHAPAIEPPINFQYLDTERVNNLYNQIEPELIEKNRTVSAGQSIEGKGNLSTGPANAEIGIGKKQEATSSFERASFSTARKCTELMKFVLEQNRAHYYTDGGTWYIKASMKEAKDAYDKALREIANEEITEPNLDKLRIPFVGARTAEEKKEAERQIKEHETELKAELSGLSGLVFVDATFDVHRSRKGGITLTEVFAEKPEQVIFKIIGLEATNSGELAGRSKSHLRVFGGVTGPLSDEGIVEVRAIAVY